MKNYFFASAFVVGAIFAQGQTFTNGNSALPGDYHSGNCVGFVDMDGDGFDDVVALDASKTVKVLYQIAPGIFEEVDYGNVSGNNQWGMCIADYDNDGHKDVFSGGSYDGVHIKNINAVGEYTSFDLSNGSMFMQACNFADIDNDGQLDAFGCHDDALSRMWKGNGEALDYHPEFFDLTNYELQDYPGNDHSGNYGTVWSDFDNDGDTDLMIAKCRQFVNDPFDPRRVNQLWVNDGNGNYTEDAEARGLVLNEQSWTADFADVDNDGDFDCFITNHSTTMTLLENDGTGHFSDITAGSGLDVSGFVLQAKLADFDNDGFVDVVMSGGLHRYMRNNGDGTFTQIDAFPYGDTMHSFAIGDVNRDGSLDLYASYGNGYNSPDNGNDDILWVNEGNDNHWVVFDLQGISSNLDAVGAKVIIAGDFGTQIREVRSGESYGITNTFVCHFGLGSATGIDNATIKWPSGEETIMDNPAIDTYHSVLEAPCMTTVSSQASALLLCPGESATVEILGTFDSIEWSNGEAGNAIEVSESGNYSAVVYDENGCVAVTEIYSITVQEPEIPEITVLGDLSFCEGGSVDLVGPADVDCFWSTGAETQSINVTASGEYNLSVEDVCGNLTSSEVITVSVNPVPETPEILDVSIEPGNVAVFNGESETLHWYAEENDSDPLHVGSTFESPVINENTSFWVEDVLTSNFDSANGGELEPNVGQYHGNSVRWLRFDAHEDVIIHSFKVRANGSANREFGVIDENGNAIATASVDVPDGDSEVIVDFFVPEGVGYGLRCFTDDPQLWRDGIGTDLSYPYDIGELATITSSTASGDNAFNYYYFFYDWNVQTPAISCASDRVEVLATVVGIPEISDKKLRVYPNPTQDYLFVESLEDFTFVITDLTGKHVNVISTPMVNGVKMDIRDFAPGMYILSSGSMRAQFMVE
ncbi:MAG: FG-GAP-like repeat-containing protein [Flavobacteriales bacterium]